MPEEPVGKPCCSGQNRAKSRPGHSGSRDGLPSWGTPNEAERCTVAREDARIVQRASSTRQQRIAALHYYARIRSRRATDSSSSSVAEISASVLPAALRISRYSIGSAPPSGWVHSGRLRSEEHTSELQSLRHLVCRLLLE